MPLWWQNGEILLEVVCNEAINSNTSVLGGGYCGRIGPQFMLLPGRGPAAHPIALPACQWCHLWAALHMCPDLYFTGLESEIQKSQGLVPISSVRDLWAPPT